MSDAAGIVERYIAAWNETDPVARRAAVGALWAEDGGYLDPLADVRGHDAIDAVIGGAQQQFAGLEFRLLGAVDAHHTIVRFRWELVPAGGGESVVEGSDVAVLDGDRITVVHGFLDKIPG
ncbi:nuclear transport factor 2 family protein [Actinocatenispora rupis]|uniref:Isomerase n=1 Tax=Actinocatenispora rupis TaxID=519421 RepID=A0A8J3JC88_9ACTN|nr:nuclear transport factor 2 family protein [Actinocatenispora rupis]GID14094.1 isomerase [Actinocatenispora rupis]